MEKLSPSSSSSVDHKAWTEAQDLLKQKLIAEDDFSWGLDSKSNLKSMEREEEKEEEREELLKYVGGVDISYSKENPSMACGILVVLELKTLQVVYQDFCVVTPNVPYVPGFLAFREAPVLLELLEKMKNNNSPFYPQLHHVDGLTLSGVKQLLEAQEDSAEGFITLKGCSGRTWGAAARSTGGSLKPIFISTGHRISLDTATRIVKMTCKFRVPEPIRQIISSNSAIGPENLNVAFVML
ncbi:unnamed protein product [Malus baccata var. baccata]